MKTMLDYTNKIKPYFQGIAQIEPTTTAAAAHSKGERFYLNGTLVEATADIAVGATIAVNTNVKVADDVETQIAKLENIGNASGSPKTVSYANVVSIEDGIAVNAKDVSIKIEPIQAGSGTPSPSNVRAISGRDNATITRENEDASISDDYIIDLGGTIYGGTLDVTTGVLTVDRAIITLNGDSSESWSTGTTAETGKHLFAGTISGIKVPQTSSESVLLTCDQYPTLDSESIWRNNDGISVYTSGRIWVYDSSKAEETVTNWENYLSNNPLHVVYELATPQVIQLTPTQIRMLAGVNTVYANTGDTQLEYFYASVGNVGEVLGDVQEDVEPLIKKSIGNGTIVVNPETGWDCYNLCLERSGNVIHIGGFALNSSNITTDSQVKIATLKYPSVHAPRWTQRILAGCGEDGWLTYNPCYASINSDGEIFVYLPSGTVADNVSFNFTYTI